jgi:hypothetical protein
MREHGPYRVLPEGEATLQCLEDYCGALSSTAAYPGTAERTRTDQGYLAREGPNNAGSRSTYWVAKRNGSTAPIDECFVHIEVSYRLEHHRCESLVDF